ncbi:MAG: hypothetical protein HYX66_04095 [Ignavibacteria bacterium]|nr:hypothetical protein [Ignavibacteria bacterium]
MFADVRTCSQLFGYLWPREDKDDLEFRIGTEFKLKLNLDENQSLEEKLRDIAFAIIVCGEINYRDRLIAQH